MDRFYDIHTKSVAPKHIPDKVNTQSIFDSRDVAILNILDYHIVKTSNNTLQSLIRRK